MKIFMGIGLWKSFRLTLVDKIRNSNVFLRICLRLCFFECVSAKVFPICLYCFSLREVSACTYMLMFANTSLHLTVIFESGIF